MPAEQLTWWQWLINVGIIAAAVLLFAWLDKRERGIE